MEDCDRNEGFPNPEPGGEERKDDGLDEESDDTIDGHNDANTLRGETKAARDAKGCDWWLRFNSLVLEEDGEKMVVGHAVVCKDAKSNNNHDDFASEDLRFVVSLRRD